MASKRPTLIREVREVAREMLPGPRGWALIVLGVMILAALFIYTLWDDLNVD